MKANRIPLVFLTLISPSPMLAGGTASVTSTDRSALQAKLTRILALGPAFSHDAEYLSLQAGMASDPAGDLFKQGVLGHFQGLEQALANRDQALVAAHVNALAKLLNLDAAATKAALSKYLAAAAPKAPASTPLSTGVPVYGAKSLDKVAKANEAGQAAAFDGNKAAKTAAATPVIAPKAGAVKPADKPVLPLGPNTVRDGVVPALSVEAAKAKADAAKLSLARFRPVADPQGNAAGFEIESVQGKVPDLVALQKAGFAEFAFLKKFQAMELQDLLRVSFPNGLQKGARVLMLTEGKSFRLVVEQPFSAKGNMTDMFLWQGDGGLVHSRRFPSGSDTYEQIEIYHGFSEKDRGGDQHWGRMEEYKTTWVSRYSVEKDWHQSKEFTFRDMNWNGKGWNVMTEKKPENDGGWAWVTKRIGWTFENVHVYKEIGAAVGFVADRGKDFGYLISGGTGEILGKTGVPFLGAEKQEYALYGIITKWQAPGFAKIMGGDIPGQRLMDDLKAHIAPEDMKNMMAMWREEYRKAQFAATGDMALAVAIKDERTDISEEELGRYLIGGGAGMGFGGAGAEFAKRASESKTLGGKALNFTGAFVVYGTDFTMQSLGFNAIGGIANISANAAKVATAGRGIKALNAGVQVTKFAQDAYFTSLMGVQALEVGDAYSRGDRQAMYVAAAQIAGILAMPGGDHERQQKNGMFKFDWKATGKELFTTNMAVGTGKKALDLGIAGKKGGFAGVAAELGYNSAMKSGTYYDATAIAMADAARELGPTRLGKGLADAASQVGDMKAYSLNKLADAVAQQAKPGSKAAEAAQVMKAEAQSKLAAESSAKLLAELKKAEFDKKVMANVLDNAALPQRSEVGDHLAGGTASTLTPELKKARVQGLATVYETAKGTPSKRPAKMIVEVREKSITVKKLNAKKPYGEILKTAEGFEFRLKGAQKGQPGEWTVQNGKPTFKTADGKFALELPAGTQLFTGELTNALHGPLNDLEILGKKAATLPNGVDVVQMDVKDRVVKTLFPQEWTAADVAAAQRAVLAQGKVVEINGGDTILVRGEYQIVKDQPVMVDVTVGLKDGKVLKVEPAPFEPNRLTPPTQRTSPTISTGEVGKKIYERIKDAARRVMGDKDAAGNGMADKKTKGAKEADLEKKLREAHEESLKKARQAREALNEDRLPPEERDPAKKAPKTSPIEEAKKPVSFLDRKFAENIRIMPRVPVALGNRPTFNAPPIDPIVEGPDPDNDDGQNPPVMAGGGGDPSPIEQTPQDDGTSAARQKAAVAAAQNDASQLGNTAGYSADGGFSGGDAGGAGGAGGGAAGGAGEGYGEGKGAGNLKNPFGGGEGGGGGGGSSSGSADGAGSSANDEGGDSGNGGGAPGAPAPAAGDGGGQQALSRASGEAPATAAESPAKDEAPLQKLYDNNQKPVAEPGARKRSLQSSLPYDTVIPPSNLESRLPTMRRPASEARMEAPPARAARLPRNWSMPSDEQQPVEMRYEPQPWDPIAYHFYDNEVPFPGARPKEATNWDMAYIILLTIGGAAAARLFVKNAVRPEKQMPSLRTQIAKI